ncbi:MULTISPECIES: hypothetical protein [unclassified Roseateles]|uniref:hypothetical protein n=1 Tax=unclassified Roseateles TaxID=2626991 RepID=UPI0006FF6B12|nr:MULTISPECIES: hypothetical protein [unclassified Roseateles]KQW42751.1 hypothetical protein ASC81_19010 [Pelomonas sp. Root405]KRA69428.1 hypothetical protein ASD88_19660 [Pelomonas sp. Root662]
MRRALALLSLALACALPAHGMDIRACSDPVVFRGAAVNALVLPWRADGARDAAVGAASRQISSLAHLQLLMAMLKYSSVGAVDLVADGGRQCDVDRVLATVSQTGTGTGKLERGKAVLAIWGRLFEQDGELFLQTYLRFARQGAQGLTPETITLDWAGAKFEAALPAQALSFAPRRIRLDELASIDKASRAALQVRQQPSDAAPGVEIGRSVHQSFPYAIVEARGDWMRVVPMRPGLPAGWMRARAAGDVAEWQLARWLPELDFADAMAGWLRLQVGGLQPAERERVVRAVEAGLTRYEKAVPADLAPSAWGLGAALRGQIAWTQGRRADAAERFSEALQRLPASAAGTNLAAVSALSGVTPDAAAAAQLSQRLLAALALSPRDPQVLGNLQALYGVYAQRPDWSPWPPAELAERQALLRSAR